MKKNSVEHTIPEQNTGDKQVYPPPPYPKRLQKQKFDKQFAKFLEIFKKFYINITFTEALKQMTSYAKFMKGKLSLKLNVEELETVALIEECSVVLQQKMPPKLKDPGSFTILCTIGELSFDKYKDECYEVELVDSVVNSEFDQLLWSDTLDRALTVESDSEDEEGVMQLQFLNASPWKRKLAGHECYCLLDGYSGYNQICIAPEDQEKTTFTCPFGTFAFRRVSFGLCGARATFQICMMAIFSDMIEKDVPFKFDEECLTAFKTLKKKLTTTPVITAPDWDEPFEIMCDASDFAVGAVLRQRKKNIFHISGLEERFKTSINSMDSLASGIRVRNQRQERYRKPVDYVSKWVEIKALPTNNAKVVINFLHRHIFTHFDTPGVIISDEGSHFCNRKFTALMERYRVNHHVAITYHPQANGQDEVSNREIKQILEKIVSPSRKD
ncbi:uncharacterized protein LOC141703015 [Apium graveolens]|uniref:uncharacterized protein LOC141703015 n=1 Tax=Apium graveolens TaxID=4045 RepID=UPI003D79F777